MLLGLVIVQIYLGALVSGLRAGLIYNTWPLIDGSLVPDGARLFFIAPAWRNVFENTLTVQFDHRMVAYAVWLFALLHAADVARTLRGGGVLTSRARAGRGRHPAGRARHRHAAVPGAARARAAASGHGARGARDRGRACGAPRAAARLGGRGDRQCRHAPTRAGDMIETSEQAGVAVLRMADGKVNAMSIDFCAAVTTTFEQILPARAVVLTGSGRIFSAGVDLLRLLDGGPDYIRQFLPALSTMLAAVFTHPKPVVAAINGHAVAGGCVLACAADRRIMARDAGRIGVTELLVGVPFPAAAMEIMRRATAPQYFEDAILSGATYNPPEAVARGLVHDIVDPHELLDRAIDAANTLAALSPPAFAITKRQTRGPAVERLQRADVDADIDRIWTAPDTLARIRDYVSRTLRKA